MKTRNTSLASVLTIFVLLSGTQGHAMEQTITKEKKLENGLKVIVQEDHRAPVVVSQIWYKVGSSDETRWITGISHALEHMMFQGTPTLPGDGFAELISRYGGQNNAFTAEDYTAYYEELDASNLKISFEAEADRMLNLTLSAEAFAKEIQVVIEERRLRTDDNPQSVTFERFMATANPMGPYHHPIIGWQVDLDTMKVEDLRRWYESFYSPNNATLVVVGDVTAETVFALAEEYFGKIPARASTWEVRSQKEIPLLGEQRIKVHQTANLPYAIWGYAVPSLKSASNPEEAFALMVASAILDGGDSARFAKEIIRKDRIAATASTYYDLFKKYDTQFMMMGIPAEGKSVADLEKALFDHIERLKTTKVSETELKRVKAQIAAQEIFGRDSMSEQAIRIGMFETVGLGWPLLDEIVEHINRVTPEAVQAVAQKYFVGKHLTVAELVPETLTKAN
jgi:zinc protease